MKKFIYKYNKQIFSISAIFCIILSSCFCVSAEYNVPDNYSDPSSSYPTEPTYSNWSNYSINGLYPSVTGFDLLLYSSDTVSTPSVMPFTNLYDSSNIYSSGGKYYAATTNDLVSINESLIDDDVFYNDLFISLRLTGTTLAKTSILFNDFWYIPFTEYTYLNSSDIPINCRSVCKILFDGASYINSTKTFTVRGKFQFMGNTLMHEFEYTEIYQSLLRGFEITNYDIIRNSTLGDVGVSEVPIYITDLEIDLGSLVFDDSKCDFHVIMPVLSVDEHEALFYNNKTVMHNAYYNLPVAPDLDLEWIWEGVNGFFNAPFLGSLTLTHICLTFLVANLSVTLLAIINHLK